MVQRTDDIAIKRSYFSFTLKRFDLYIILLTATLLLPPVKILPMMPYFQIEEIIIYFIFPVLILLNYINADNIYKVKSFIIIILLMAFSIIVSIFYSYIKLNVNYSVRDFFEIIKVIKLILILILTSEITFTEEHNDIILKVMSFSYILIFLLAVLQYFDLFNVNKYISPLYATEHHLKNLIGWSKRVTSVASGPNHLAMLCAIGHLFFLSWIFFKKRLYFYAVAGYFASLITVFLTSSRTAIIALAFIMIFFIFFLKIKIAYKILIFTMLLLIFVFFISKSQYLYQLYTGVEIIYGSSMTARYRFWQDAFSYIKQSPIFGNGIAKEEMTTIVDNAYILQLRRVGLFGLFFMIMFYLYPLKFFFKERNWISIFLLLMITFSMICNFTASHFHLIQLSDQFILLTGMCLSQLNENKRCA